jgi:hypothetical protein
MKWNLPPTTPPSWLDPTREISRENDQSKLGNRGRFIGCLVDTLLSLGLDLWGAFEVCGNTILETRYGELYHAWNLGGWKITKGQAEALAKLLGHPPNWWRAPGNKAPDATYKGWEGATVTDLKGGDPPWCYYRAFTSMGEFLTEWLKHFVPHVPAGYDEHKSFDLKPHKHDGNYKETGRLFWLKDPAWFLALCAAGYKGENTEAHPEGSYANQAVLVNEAKEYWAQAKLGGLTVDGAWGTKSKEACAAFQKLHGLPQTAVPDMPTLSALLIKARAEGLNVM